MQPQLNSTIFFLYKVYFVILCRLTSSLNFSLIDDKTNGTFSQKNVDHKGIRFQKNASSSTIRQENKL